VLVVHHLEKLGMPGEMAAKCAIDGALHDLLGKLCGQPLWRMFGLDPAAIPPTSYTISIDTVEGTADRTRRAGDFRALKIKVGGPDDLERVRAVRREAPGSLIRVDANEAWTVETTRQPSTAEAPPDSPLPAPRGTTGTPLAAANRTATCTSSVEPARTTASGTPASGSLARSQRYLSIRSGSVTTTSSPSSETSGPRSTCTAAVM